MEDYAPELPAPVNVAPANDAGAAQHLLALAPPADPQAPSEPIVVEVADFHVLGEAHAALGNDLVEMLADGANTMEFGTHRLNASNLGILPPTWVGQLPACAAYVKDGLYASIRHTVGIAPRSDPETAAAIGACSRKGASSEARRLISLILALIAKLFRETF